MDYTLAITILRVQDIEKERRFYHEALGWEFAKYADMDYWLTTTGPRDQLGIDGAVNEAVNVFANYSYQATPDPDFDISEVNLPPKNRFNIGTAISYGRFLGNLSVGYTDSAFWQDVLDDRYHGRVTDPVWIAFITAGFLVVMIACSNVSNLLLARDIAKQARFHKIAISIDDLGAECSSLVGLQDFPFVEMKADREFVSGCADDRLKRTMCRQIRELADHYGARAVAEGVETRADFLTVRELGFDLVQGFLFGKPMTLRKFGRTMMRHVGKVPE